MDEQVLNGLSRSRVCFQEGVKWNQPQRLCTVDASNEQAVGMAVGHGCALGCFGQALRRLNGSG